MTVTITSWWWTIPTILSLVTWIWLYIRLEVSQDTSDGFTGGLDTLFWLLLSGFGTSLFWLVYFIIF